MPELRRLFSLETLAPLVLGILVLSVWEISVSLTHTPSYILPGPILILKTLIQDRSILLPAMLVTLKITIVAFLVAMVSGLFLAMIMAQSKWIEKSLYPYAIILQTIPMAAIAPLIVIWMRNNTFAALVICAWIIAFFPIVSNTTFGLNSLDPNLKDLFKLYQASRWQTLLYLRLPSALPYFFAGLRISGGLALIGAVVAEIVAGTGGMNSGLAYQILLASYNLQIPRMFAALLLIGILGILIFIFLNRLSSQILGKWHDSSTPLDP
ncbi:MULTISPECIES: ABC transporter permease [unclassified Roseofilum]|uniref:ABC transporter permease n=1 Tax=unclassified Roseofilum TaxID=2620099 RepID=UPI000E9D8239|nr:MULTISPECIES: ABC transporter permease [unclassified Roseofilum]MBP0008087.1 ABC transporter permease [Roseofilum sp. Belize Diploria]MBP0034506.1 ABC transporter permease [Roseofilum sp. Belize BBD 4]HBQ97101.1 ABC transporter ATP-binding protein [Cyanobacteria bacterium UBA11691]